MDPAVKYKSMRVEDQMDQEVATALELQSIDESDGSRLNRVTPVQQIMKVIG